jgi:hypothetical protein
VFGVVRKRHFKIYLSEKVVHSNVYHRLLMQPCQGYSFNAWSALRQAHSPFRSDISTKLDLVLPLSMSI